MTVRADAYVERALTGGYLGIPYEKLDCQAFVEQVLKDCNALTENWRGTNHMWREAVYDRSDDMGTIVPGEWVFKVAHDGGEIPRGYNDDMGNAYHVGIYCGDGEVIHSTTGGVQMGTINGWTHHAKCIDVDYGDVLFEVDTIISDSLIEVAEALVRLAEKIKKEG